MFYPITTDLDFETGLLKQFEVKVTRRLSDMKGMYQDEAEFEKKLAENPIIYEVFERRVPLEEGHLVHSVTVINPGKIGKEYYMTKGHYHEQDKTAEIYLGLKGRGYVLMMNRERETTYREMNPGTIVYVPPFWAHRTINVGSEKVVFLCVYPANAGHDYGSIEKSGFSKIVIEENQFPKIIDV